MFILVFTLKVSIDHNHSQSFDFVSKMQKFYFAATLNLLFNFPNISTNTPNNCVVLLLDCLSSLLFSALSSMLRLVHVVAVRA